MSDDPLASPIPLTGPDAVILHRLAQVVAMGKHSGTYDAADVVRVAEAHLPNPHTLRRQLMNERARTDRAEAENERLRAKVRQLGATQMPLPERPESGPPVVYLTAKRAEVLELMKTGASGPQIARQLGLSASAAADRMRHVVAEVGATRQQEAVALVLSGSVEVRVLEEGKRAA